MTPSFPPSADLVAVLTSDTDPQKKALACQQLAVVGGTDAVPALAWLLEDEQLADYARCALELIPAPAAGTALQQALAKLNGRRLAGVIDSLGVRREVAAVPELCRLAAGPADDVAAEALAALGKIASPEALACVRTALQSPAAGRRLAAGHAALAAVNVLLKQGDAKSFAGMLDALATANLPVHVTAAAVALVTRGKAR